MLSGNSDCEWWVVVITAAAGVVITAAAGVIVAVDGKW